MKTPPVSAGIFGFLRRTDTCTVSNAIETLSLRMRNEGFVQGDVRCLFPNLPPIAGYAVTGTLDALGFRSFAQGFRVPHTYAHIVGFGTPVRISGMTIESGDLLHGDLNRIHSVPLAAVDLLRGIARDIVAHEAESIARFRARNFSVDRLEATLRRAADHVPRPEVH